MTLFRGHVWPFWVLCLTASMCELQYCAAQSTTHQIPSDWDLYMLRLVNRARTDPAAEDVLHGTSFAEHAVPPLAYSTLLGSAAQNHNEWMGDNRNNPAMLDPTNLGPAPHSLSHFETLDAQPGGPSGSELTVGWSGDDVGQRITFTGYTWGRAGENISWRSDTPPIHSELIDSTHVGWWNSDGHRANLMRPEFTVFGHHAMNDLDDDNPNHWATQNFARPLFSPFYDVLGLLYEDKDDNGDWTPRDAGDPMREGLGGVSFDVLRSGTEARVASGQTHDNGAYSINVPDGTYDIVFNDSSLPDTRIMLAEITVSGKNMDAGDTLVVTPSPLLQAGDANQDFRFDQLDVVMVLGAGKYLTGQSATWGQGDWNAAPGGSRGEPPAGDGLFNQLDIVAAQQSGLYLSGPYAVLSPNGRLADESLQIIESAIDNVTPLNVLDTFHKIPSMDGEPRLEPGRGAGGLDAAYFAINVVAVPEPSTVFLMVLGAVVMAIAAGLRARRGACTTIDGMFT